MENGWEKRKMQRECMKVKLTGDKEESSEKQSSKKEMKNKPDNVSHEKEEDCNLERKQNDENKLILSTWRTGGEMDPDDLDQRQDQGAKSQGACVVSTQEEREDGISRDVISSRQRHLAQRRHKVCTPEEEEDVRLTTVKSKQAFCTEKSVCRPRSRIVTSAPGSPFRAAYSM
uniref:Uncharacterized protein n=1 Tax=Poecilia reticulata TaxID=8081 RepID=A0A3P9PCJ1_POERE